MENSAPVDPKTRIIETAVTLFASKGYANTGMRELAEKSEVNLAMINYYFGGKKKLLIHILDTFFAGYLAIIEEELPGPNHLDQKLRQFIYRAVEFIARNRDYMVVTLTELPHDDPEIIEYKANWAKKAMLIINKEICFPLSEERGTSISPGSIGPLIICMMSSRFLFAPIMEKVQPPGYTEKYDDLYPEIIADIFLNGINGLNPKG